MGNEIQAQLNESLPIRRALTGRDESGKSVFVSFDATPRVIAFETRPGLVFWEMYAADESSTLTGREPNRPGLWLIVPGPQGSRFACFNYHVQWQNPTLRPSTGCWKIYRVKVRE